LNEFSKLAEDFSLLARLINFGETSTDGDVASNIENFFTTMNDCETMQVPGSAATVIHAGEVVLQKAFGKSDLVNNVDTTLDTVFGIGSTTKALTAFVIGSLVDEGALQWDTEIRDVIPRWYSPSARDNERVDATLEDALTHRMDLLKNNNKWFFNISTEDARVITRDWKETFPQIQHFRYDFEYFNFGYTLAGAVASTVTNKNIHELIRERFFAKLGLTSGVYTTTAEALQNPALYAYPYALDADYNVVPLPREGNTVLDGAVAAAGSVYMSIKSLTTYLTSMQTGLSEVVSPDSFKRITYPRQDTFPTNGFVLPLHLWFHSYGHGWLQGTYRGERFIWHNGGTVGHTTLMMVFPDQKISIGVLTNQLAITSLTHILFGLYSFDQIMGYDSLFTPDNICSRASATPVGGPELWAGLTTTVTNPNRYAGTYCNCDGWKKLYVTKGPVDTVSLAVGIAKGLLRQQDGNSFLWFGEDWCEPEEYTVRFADGGVYVNLNKEDGDQLEVFFKKIHSHGHCHCQ